MLNKPIRKCKPKISLVFLCLLVLLPMLSHAQVLEEIIVTSQKRAESLQDVSVSVTALSGEKLADSAIARLEEVTAFVPNFTLSETGIGTNIYIRGIGSGINQGFEQSVGMYFDGIYYARAQLARSPIFDLERLEVLKGPQVTLFGNNSIGGAISINSAKPTDYFEGSAKLLLSPGHGEEESTLIFSGPLSKNFNARLSIRDYKMDGYMFNASRNRDEPNRDYLTSRLSLQFLPENDAFEANLKLEHSTFDIQGRQIAIIRDEPTNYLGTSQYAVTAQSDFGGNPDNGQNTWADPTVLLQDYLPNFDAWIAARNKEFGPAPNLAEIFSSGLSISAAEAGGYNDGLIYQKIGGTQVAFPYQLERRGANDDYSRNTVDSAMLSFDVPLKSGDLKLISGYLNYNYDELCDCDFTGADLVEYQSNEQYEQLSQEIRFTSAEDLILPLSNIYGDYIEDVSMDFIIGAYYQKDDLSFNDYVIVLEDSALEETLSFIFSQTPPERLQDIIGISAPREFEVNSELIAGFASTTLHFTESTRLMLGIRESRVKKKGYRKLTYRLQDLVTPLSDTPYSGQPQVTPYESVSFIFDAALRVNPHEQQEERKEKRTSWSIILEHDINDDYMLYLSAVNGFKGGGFDTRSNNPDNWFDFIGNDGAKINDELIYNNNNCSGYSTGDPNIPEVCELTIPTFYSPGTFQFEDEEALAFELGLKARIADRAEVNMAYFYTDIEDLQLSIFDGGVGFNVSNAGLAVTQGLEIEGRIFLTEHWFMNASLAWMEFEYKDYKDGLCTSTQKMTIYALEKERLANNPTGDSITSFENCSILITEVPGSNTQIRTPLADLTGETNQYVSDYSGSISIEYQNNINDKLLFKGGLDFNFTDDYNPAQNLDPELQQKSYRTFNIRLAIIDDANDKWEVAVMGRNITDEKIVGYANDVPLSSGLFGTKTSYGFIQRPESWALQAKYNF